MGEYRLLYDMEDSVIRCNGCAVFKKKDESMYMYKNVFGNWVVGTNLLLFYYLEINDMSTVTGSSIGKKKTGVLIRSYDMDKDTFTQLCPCRVNKLC